MAYIETHQSLRDHRKILALAAELDMPEAHVAGHCIFLWLWSIDNAADGILPASERMIERAAGWFGTPGILVAALVNAGLLERAPDGSLLIHDWWDYAGKLIEKRKSDAERKRLSRANTGQIEFVPRTSAGHPRDGAGNVEKTTAAYRSLAQTNTSDPTVDTTDEDSPMGSISRDVAAHDDESTQLEFAQMVAHAAKMTAYDPEALATLILRFQTLGRAGLLDEATAAAAWIANPEKNKAHRRMNLDFLRNWYKKAAEGYRHEGQHDSPTTAERRTPKRSASARATGQRGCAPEPGSHEHWAQVRAERARQKAHSASGGPADDESAPA